MLGILHRTPVERMPFEIVGGDQPALEALHAKRHHAAARHRVHADIVHQPVQVGDLVDVGHAEVRAAQRAGLIFGALEIDRFLARHNRLGVLAAVHPAAETGLVRDQALLHQRVAADALDILKIGGLEIPSRENRVLVGPVDEEGGAVFLPRSHVGMSLRPFDDGRYMFGQLVEIVHLDSAGAADGDRLELLRAHDSPLPGPSRLTAEIVRDTREANAILAGRPDGGDLEILAQVLFITGSHSSDPMPQYWRHREARPYRHR